MQQHKQQRGFTLIELIIVIVILGILAVTAAPKFIDIQGDATASTLQGVKAALQGGSQLVYAKSAIAGNQKNANVTGTGTTDNVTINSVKIETEYGYPDADSMTAAMILGWVDLNFTATTGDWTLHDDSPAVESFSITPLGGSVNTAPTGTNDDTRCHVTYTNASSAGDSPDLIAYTEGC